MKEIKILAYRADQRIEITTTSDIVPEVIRALIYDGFGKFDIR